MNKRLGLRIILASATLLAAIGVAWIFSLPATPDPGAAPPIETQETDAMLAALKPPKRERPLIAIIGINEGTEVTDYLMPYGILKRTDVADVVALATEPGPLRLYPALQVEPDATIAQFDAQYPDGADYIVVPAMSRDDDPAALTWIRGQAGKGAIVIAVCAGVKVAGEAGLLDNKRATTHWYFVDELRDRVPSLHYVADRRLVADQGIATTTGISASMPMMLTLIESIAGRDKAMAVARDLGLSTWDARHNSSAFKITRAFAATVLGNVLAFWKRDQLGIELVAGMDEVSLAIVADAWSRTYRSSTVTFASSADAVDSRSGLRIIPDRVATEWPDEQLVPAFADRKPAEALDQALFQIGARYGDRTARVVAMQLEYPRREVPREENQ